MENTQLKPLSNAICTQLISTPHPVSLDGQRNELAAFLPHENLESFLRRCVHDFDNGDWIVIVGGVEVPQHHWHLLYPKPGGKIEVIGRLGKAAITLVAIAVLSYYTFGLASGVASGTGLGGALAGALGNFGAYAAIASVQIAGTLLVNKVMAPKAQKPGSSDTAATVYQLTSSSNQARQYGAVPILFGKVMVAPDLLSTAYAWYQDDDQYLGMHLCWGIGVDHFDPLYLGSTLLSTYDSDVTEYNTGFSGIADQTIPLFGNVDTIAGGDLQDDDKNLLTVSRTTSENTVRIDWDIQYQLYDYKKSGSLKYNQETVVCQYRPVGSATWLNGATLNLRRNATRVYRTTATAVVAAGQYETQIYRTGQNSDGDNATCVVTLSTLTSIQADTSTYTGVARTGLQLKASSQLNGTPDQVQGIAYATAIPVWDGTEWVTQFTSNAGAWMLKYLRGWFDASGRLIAGCGYSDDDIDIEAFQGFMVFCAANSFTYDFWLTDDRDHLTTLEAIGAAAMAEYTDALGLHSVVWLADDQPVDGIVNMARVQAATFQVDYTVMGTTDGIALTYVDTTTVPWSEKTLQIPSPTSGTTTITNPASITAEGVTDPDIAAKIGRLFMAQSVYQYKSIAYSTSLEYLTYRRYSVIQLQHDVTQWGFGGTIVNAFLENSKVVLVLDDNVPAPAALVTPYIGLRIPGEAGYRVFKVDAFGGADTNTISLTDPWPTDAAFPGDSDGNPFWDTLWIYDFKATPGLSARVVGVAPSSSLKGATITVVPESSEFWDYVATGHYVPATSGSLLNTRPVASNLSASEQYVTIGNVSVVELAASFQISGPVGTVRVYCDVNQQNVLELVAEVTSERTASWEIDEARTYTIVVRPYSPEGLAGTPVTATFASSTPGSAPVNIDTLTITDNGTGIRTYSWGFNDTTIQSPNMMGVEIRYVAGTVANPVWEDMISVAGNSNPNYFTSAFQSGVPDSGTWTFGARVIDTGGVLSNGMLVKTVTLASSLGQLVTSLFDTTSKLTQDLTADIADVNSIIAKEVSDREAAVDSLTGQIQTNANAITTTQKSLSDYESSNNTITTNLNSQVALNTSNLSSLQQTVSNNDSATTSALSTLNSNVSLNTSDISNLQQTVADDQSANASTFQSLQARINPQGAGDTTWGAGDSSVYAGTITIQSVAANDTFSQSQRIDQLTSNFSNNSAQITNINTTLSNYQSSTATSIAQLTAKTDSNTAAVQVTSTAVANINGTLSSAYVVQVQVSANGTRYLSGIALGVDYSGGSATSTVIVNASQFAVIDASTNGNVTATPFVVKNGAIYANIAIIEDGTITDAKIGNMIQSTATNSAGKPTWIIDKAGTITFNGNIFTRVDSSTGTKMTNAAGIVVIQWGDLSA